MRVSKGFPGQNFLILSFNQGLYNCFDFCCLVQNYFCQTLQHQFVSMTLCKFLDHLGTLLFEAITKTIND